MNIKCKELREFDINYDLFADFNRHQEVTKCWRKEDNTWVLKDIAFIEEWMETEKNHLVQCLLRSISSGGKVCGAFENNTLVGFLSVEKELFGSEKQYVELTSLHVSAEYRGMGIGKLLFHKALQYCSELGAKKLYISAHSSEESQAFYKAMGCVEAEEYNMAAVEKEPCDCQLECSLLVSNN